ncbi:hypothetical protein BV87_09305 [Sphingobium yanoikuyae]|uniref:Minor tail T domain-containing protein n=2 Tax=Sphingobium yanoikuyae TaxID=13690 RepID=A0A2D1R121_SPHYA|nr:hypothetical protein BV87_09305 [Sphingobium yanoikuyae]
MGRTVEELSASLSDDELTEWMAFYDVEPFGCAVEDDRARHIVSILFNAYDGKNEPDWFDRDPDWTAELRRRAAPTADELEDKIDAFFSAKLTGQDSRDAA